MSFCKVSPQTSDLFFTTSSSPWPNIVAAHGSGRRRRRKAWSGTQLDHLSSSNYNVQR
jgi:hypothetical protein